MRKEVYPMTFGEKLKELRLMKDWSQDTLAKEIGVSRRTIIASKTERAILATLLSMKSSLRSST